jgi:RNA polymerase sigma-70 factor (ECF subfamily)
VRLLLPWRRDAAAGLRLLDELEASREPRDDFLLPASRADLLRRAGDWTAAPQARCQALQLAGQQEGRRFFAPASGDGEQT